MTRVLIVADAMVMRAGLERVLAGRFEIVGILGHAQAAAQIEELAPDVVVAHGNAPEIGAEWPVVVLAEEAADGLTGAHASLSSAASEAQIVAAVDAVAAGLAVNDPEQARQVGAGTLTARESEVLRMLASGDSNKIIAFQLGISEHTAKFHVASILAKLGAGSRAEAVALGIRRGLIYL